MANTGRQLCYRWSYKQDGQVIDTCGLIKSIGANNMPIFYTEQEVKLLSDSAYATLFNATRAYMSGVLGWTVLPELSESNRQNLIACPIGGGSGTALIADVIMRLDLTALVEQMAGEEAVTVYLYPDASTTNALTANIEFSPVHPTAGIPFFGFTVDMDTLYVGIRIGCTVGGFVNIYDKNNNNLLSGVLGVQMLISSMVFATLYDNGEIELKVKIS